ncbi:hypothetical protein C0992_009734 [Termitomyces sp. T32_za158]|nr:hypothetical protein C0992_009734 [Termitomyces sp. T32_za158]
MGTISAGLEDGRRIRGKVGYSTNLRFPSKTQGFLYYHCHPHLPPTTGEIRFRVTESFDPTYFHNGTDLVRADGALPWSIPLNRLTLVHAPLKELLGQNHNIPATIFGHKKKFLLSYLEQPFVMNLERPLYSNLLDFQLRTCMRVLYSMPRTRKRTQSVYKGKLLVRFEQASLAEQKEDTSIVMRVLKVLEPIQPLVKDAALLHPAPEAGSLLKVSKLGQIRTVIFKDSSFRHLPSITGSSPNAQIRFRLTSSDDPTQFEKGTDLFDACGQPWNIDIRQLAFSLHALKAQLCRDGYVEITKAISRLLPAAAPSRCKRILYYLEQPFVIDMTKQYIIVLFSMPDKVVSTDFAFSSDLTGKIRSHTGIYASAFKIGLYASS